jgi:hypothetical protein
MSFDLSLLIPIAIHSCDVITTKKLFCICKTPFESIDIWSLKFDYEYRGNTYIRRWGSYYNYLMKKTWNFSLLALRNHYCEIIIDKILYEYNPIYDKVLTFCSNGLEFPFFIINVNVKNSIILLEGINCGEFKIKGYYSCIDNAKDVIMEDITKYKKLKQSMLVEHIIINLEEMNPRFLNNAITGAFVKSNEDQKHPWYKHIRKDL